MYNDQSNFMHQFWKVEGLSTTEWKMSAMGAMMMVLGNGGADLILWQCPSKCLLSYTCIYAFRYFKLLKITYTMHTIVWTNFNFRYMYIIYHTGPNNPELVYLQMSIFIPFLYSYMIRVFILHKLFSFSESHVTTEILFYWNLTVDWVKVKWKYFLAFYSTWLGACLVGLPLQLLL